MNAIRVVLIGCGGISNAWLGYVKNRRDIELVGLVDLDKNAADKRAVENGLTGIETGTDFKAVLRRTKPDVVFDCTVPEAHVTVTTTALQLGCHVLGEKPLADTMPHARKMVAAAKASGKIYAVMQNRRYMANIQALRRFLKSGAIGRITTVHCDFIMGAHFGGFRDHMKHVLLLDMAIHTFDQARFLTGEDSLTALAYEWNPPGSWYDHDASAISIFEMTNNVVYTYRGSWCAEGLPTSWVANWRIIGEQGSVTWDGDDTFRAQVVTSKTGFKRETRDIDVSYDRTAEIVAGHAGCIDEFIRCLRTGELPQTVCTDNIKSLAMVHAAIESAGKGQKVYLQI